MSLSVCVGYWKDRGDCIMEFQRLWNGMEFCFSYVKVVCDVDEQVIIFWLFLDFLSYYVEVYVEFIELLFF